MMTLSVTDFAETIIILSSRYRFSCTSWGRTPKRNRLVGGHENSRHLLWLAVDVVLDSKSDLDAFIADAHRLGLRVFDEGDHLHVQPMG